MFRSRLWQVLRMAPGMLRRGLRRSVKLEKLEGAPPQSSRESLTNTSAARRARQRAQSTAIRLAKPRN